MEDVPELDAIIKYAIEEIGMASARLRKKDLDDFRMSKPKQIRVSTDTTEIRPSHETDAAEEDLNPGLTISYDEKTIFSGVGKDFLKELWSRADALIQSSKSSISSAPGFNGCYVRHSFGARGGKKKISKPRRGGRAPVPATSVREVPSVQRTPLVVDTRSLAAVVDDLEKFEEVEETKFEILYLFQTKASICYGCSRKFERDEHNNRMIIRVYCQREYKVTGDMKKKWQFAYFHLKKPCVTNKFPDFTLTDIVIANECKDIIPDTLLVTLTSHGVKL
ncbi:unnamed protein product [Mytilus coruscus]|uniref:Uncharacterized protein n=1 Tax=Mytilus coruscus TaxID=42192 RepID=A0A6J8AJ40_MYTCO|nr:unnamed protein product [Mytilus coruscus]